MRSLLDHQADGIEYTLHSHGIEASVVGGNVSPRLIQFQIKVATGVKYNRVAALTDDLALALGVDYCRVTRDGYFVRVEIPRADPVLVRLFALLENLPAELPEIAPVLGLDENGLPLLVRLASADIGHILITGAPDAGKTVLTQAIIASLALQNGPDHLRMLLVDTDHSAYSAFDGLPNLFGPIITEAYDGILKLRWLVREMEKRAESGRATPAIALIIDEVADLVRVSTREVTYALARLTQEGRELGIHVIAATHSPQVISSISKCNFSTRAVGYVQSAADARLASGRDDSEADRLMGQGDFLLYTRSQVTRLQAAHLTPEEMALTVAHLGGRPGISPRTAQRRALQGFVAEETGSGTVYASTETHPSQRPTAFRTEPDTDVRPAAPYTYPERTDSPPPPRPIRPVEERPRKVAESRSPYTYETADAPEEPPTSLAERRRRAQPPVQEDDFADIAVPNPRPARQENAPPPQRTTPEPPTPEPPAPQRRPISNQVDMAGVLARRSEPVVNSRTRPAPEPVRRPPTPAPLARYGSAAAPAPAYDDNADPDYGEPDYLADDSQVAPDERPRSAPILPSAVAERRIPLQINVGRSNNPNR